MRLLWKTKSHSLLQSKHFSSPSDTYVWQWSRHEKLNIFNLGFQIRIQLSRDSTVVKATYFIAVSQPWFHPWQEKICPSKHSQKWLKSTEPEVNTNQWYMWSKSLCYLPCKKISGQWLKEWESSFNWWPWNIVPDQLHW